MAIERTCEYCGKKFYVKPYSIKKGQGRFCSKKCFYEGYYPHGCTYLGCKEPHHAHGYCKKHYRELPEVKQKEKETSSIWYKNHSLSYHSKIRNAYYGKIRNTILMHYSNGTLKCARCGFDDIRALDIDHINNKAEDRKKFGKNVYCFYIELAKKLPDGYQVLCRNCNWIKHIENLRSKYGSSDTSDL